MSRSGDECVVALTDQWYLVYGEAEWQAATATALAQLECYGDDAKHAFQHCLGEPLLGAWGAPAARPWSPALQVQGLRRLQPCCPPAARR
jgi:hypothetical protein